MEIQFPRAPLPLFDDLTDHVLVAGILPPFENAHDIVVRLHALVDPDVNSVSLASLAGGKRRK